MRDREQPTNGEERSPQGMDRSSTQSKRDAPLRKRRGRLTSERTRHVVAAFLFISPWIIGFIIFTGGPMVASIVLAFTRYDVINPPTVIGVENFRTLVTDPKIGISLYDTFFYALLHVPLSLTISMILALILNRLTFATGFFRTAYYMPSMTPAVAVGTLWLWLLNPYSGLINRGLGLVGINGPGWTTDPHWIKPGIILMSLWSVGSTVIIYLAALQQVPKALYEAAEIDGATGWQKFFHITLPLMSAAVFFTLIVNTIAALQIFTEVYTMYFGTMQSGAASEAALFYNIYIFRQAFEFLHMGYASAMAWLIFVIILAMTLIQLRYSSRWVYYEGG